MPKQQRVQLLGCQAMAKDYNWVGKGEPGGCLGETLVCTEVFLMVLCGDRYASFINYYLIK